VKANAVMGWDLGGAHVKAAVVDVGRVRGAWQRPSPLWEDLESLPRTVADLMRAAGSPGIHVITMTGELADAFTDRTQGVRALLEMFQSAVSTRRCMVYAHPARFLTLREALRRPLMAASMNWSATAEWVARRLPNALLVDVGSTTTDLVTVRAGLVAAQGVDDAQRLASEELVYTGVVRTPVMAMTTRVPFDGAWHAPMAEHFATSADVYRLTRELPPGADQLSSADGAGKSRRESARRLARMLGRDFEMASMAAWEECARFLAEAQLWSLQQACERILSRGSMSLRAPIVGAGVGRFLAKKLAQRLRRPYRDFSVLVPSRGADAHWIASCAPAVAVALLADSSTKCKTRGHVGRQARG
jgi:(4-(4-[2-(gamma-L-glutamylamino)ethyl]phenoxymethyl)furan-2-yl)methanamine synthase